MKSINATGLHRKSGAKPTTAFREATPNSHDNPLETHIQGLPLELIVIVSIR
jgi:hypothetical protein